MGQPGQRSASKTNSQSLDVGGHKFSQDAAEILNPDFSAKILDARMPQRGEPKFAWLEGRVNDPAPWTAETPNLYTLVLTLNDEKGTVSWRRTVAGSVFGKSKFATDNF